MAWFWNSRSWRTRRADPVAKVQVLSLPCDRIWGTRGRIPTFVERDVEPVSEWSTPIQTEAGRRQETSMNHSIYSADRTTHLKIVVVALVAGILVAGFGITTRATTS